MDKANFDEDARGAYERERNGNSVLQERLATEAKLREENAKAYDEWIVQKEMRDSALKCLALVPKPVAEVPVAHDDVRGSANLRRSTSAPANVTTLGKFLLFLSEKVIGLGANGLFYLCTARTPAKVDSFVCPRNCTFELVPISFVYVFLMCIANVY